RNGKCFGVYELGKPVLYLSDPELIREVLVKDFHIFTNRRDVTTGGDPLIDNMVDALRDDHWKRVRTVISPAFATGKLRQMVPLIRECVHTLTDNLDKIIAESNGELTAPVDMKQLAGAYAMEAIIQVAFGSKVSALTDVNHPIIKYVRKMTDPGGFNLTATLVTLAPKVAQLLRIPLYDTSVTEFFKEFALKLIDERKRETQMGKGCKRADFLQLILNEMSGLREGSNDKNVGSDSEKYGEIQAPDMVGKTITYDELISQCVAFLLVGYETTATALSLCLYHIGKHPDVQQKLFNEVKKYLEHIKSDTDSYDTLGSLKYMDAVVAETLRLFPATVSTEREANRDYTLRGTGITIKKDHIVHIPTYALHRDPEHFPQPDEFKPERFLADKITHHSYAYLPFGAGPRNCIGMRLAQTEIKLALINLVDQYKFYATQVSLIYY
ncbi:unnamed protein product, partial [Oppiella nova]